MKKIYYKLYLTLIATLLPTSHLIMAQGLQTGQLVAAQENEGGGDGIRCQSSGQVFLLDYSDFYVGSAHSEFFTSFVSKLEEGDFDLNRAISTAQQLLDINFDREGEPYLGFYKAISEGLIEFSQKVEIQDFASELRDAGFMGAYFEEDETRDGSCRLVQLAITCRNAEDNSSRFCSEGNFTTLYTINREYWDRLSRIDQVGLILHEVIYRYYIDQINLFAPEEETIACRDGESKMRDIRFTSSNTRLLNYFISQGFGIKDQNADRQRLFNELIEGFLDPEKWIEITNDLVQLGETKIDGLRLDGGSLSALRLLSDAVINNLKYLYGGGNELTNLNCLPERLPGLLELDLSHNQLTNLEGLPQELDSLQVLNLSGNLLTSLEGLPSVLPELRSLQLSKNRLKSLEHMPNELPELRSLYLFKNKLKSLEHMPNELPELRTLNLLDARFTHTNSDNPIKRTESSCPTDFPVDLVAQFCQRLLE